ncbi:MAG: 30S ribosomal protein S18 [Chloroflexota bacterium]|nr:30S ribosomal protein S18 [Chloroflexota bacterium]
MADTRTRRPRFRGSRRRRARRQVCGFCVDKVQHVDYKQSDALRRYVTERGQIRPRRKSGLCAKHQRRVARAVKRARFMALLPYTAEQIRLQRR